MVQELQAEKVKSFHLALVAKPIISEVLDLLKSNLSVKYAYHSAAHTEDVLNEVIQFAVIDGLPSREVELLAVAAAYHDSGFLDGPQDHEERSALSAEAAMREVGEYTEEEIDSVKEMIIKTRHISTGLGEEIETESGLAGYLLDADLSNYGRDDFFQKADLVIEELVAERSQFLRRTLENLRAHNWHTPAARGLRDAKLRENTAKLAAMLDPGVVAVIRVVQPDGVSEIHSLRDKESLRAGRVKANDIVIKDPGVSRFHAVFSASLSGVVLSDLSSLNGTFVNERGITGPTNVSSEDDIKIGGAKFFLYLRPSETFGVTETAGLVCTVPQEMRAVYVTVLVADVRGYTMISESLPPEDVAAMLDVWFRKATEIVKGLGGEVDKFIGDCVMAVWLGSDMELCAKHAVTAAVEITNETKKLSTTGKWKHGRNHPWRCRVALNSGEALSGLVGDRDARDFTVLGDTVNVAFRLERVAKQFGKSIVLGYATGELVKDHFYLEEVDKVHVEGREEMVKVYALAS